MASAHIKFKVGYPWYAKAFLRAFWLYVWVVGFFGIKDSVDYEAAFVRSVLARTAKLSPENVTRY